MTSDSKDAQIQALQERFDARSKVANERSWTISARDARISLLSDRLSERDAKIVELRDRLSERDTKKPRYAIGCHADGANAMEDINATIIDLVESLPEELASDSTRRIVHESKIQIDEWIISQAIDALNEATLDTRAPFTWWGFENGGDFGLWPDVNEMERGESTLFVKDVPDFVYTESGSPYVSTVYRVTVEEVWSA